MRLVIVGCEYSGKTTLLNGLMKWGQGRGIHFHLDDHFSIPDSQHLRPEDWQAMVNLSPVLKERFQRFQIVYHIHLLYKYEHILLSGFHIEEAIYGPLYYYPGINPESTWEYEKQMPQDTILLLLETRPEVIYQRMEQTPHGYQTIRQDDVPLLLKRFEEGFGRSWIRHKFRIDTSELTPEQLLERFLSGVLPHLNSRDYLARLGEQVGLR